jgi:ribosomal protein L30E
VVAENIPRKMKEEIEHNSKVSNIKIETFSGTSKELGVVCGKQFPISALAIKG